jgi:hypothetical protein
MSLSTLLLAFAIGQPSAAEPAAPLALHPDNPRYFLFRGKPAFLITSGEHYGAVLNRDFDYLPYLDELAARGFNLTRVFSGTYREVPGSFGIRGNTLAPKPDSYLCPWARTEAPGAGDGGRFDLRAWDPEYFARLKDFMTQAGKRGIVAELVFFCTLYDDQLWAVNPMNPRNNVQGLGPASRLEVYSGKDQALTAAQEALVRKLVTELNAFDNVYYEICNEPYERAGHTREWNDRMVAAIVAAETSLPAKHLIAQGIAVRSAKVEDPHPRVSVFNFHSAEAASVDLNYHLARVIADDETGGKGTADFPYRREAWEFLLAGGGVVSHLDFSFTCESPAGEGGVKDAPGGGGPAIRKQLQVLKEFLTGFDFIRMRPENGVLRRGAAPGQRTARVLAEPGKAYAIYVAGGAREGDPPGSGSAPAIDLVLELPAGSYRAEWLNPRTGEVDKTESFDHPGGARKLVSPPCAEDIALGVKRAPSPRNR